MNLARLDMMARDLMLHHGLTQQGWTIGWNERRATMGLCRGYKHIIEFSRPITLLNTEDQMLDTVLHEIAHALAGPQAGHSRIWKLCAQSIGARPERCGGSEAEIVPGKYQAICPKCGKDFHCYRRRRAGKNSRCPCYRSLPWDASQHLIFKAVA